MPRESTADERICFEQLCEMARSYGNLRFLFSTFFTAVMGGLLLVDLGHFGPVNAPFLINFFRASSLVLAIVFSLGEYRIAELVITYQELAESTYAPRLTLPTPQRHELWKLLARWIMITPLALAGLYFFIRLVGALCLPE